MKWTVILPMCLGKPLRHWSVEDVERNFDLSVADIQVKTDWRRVLWKATEAATDAAKRVLAEDAAGNVEQIALFLEHRASMALRIRKDFQKSMRQARHPLAMAVVAGDNVLLDREGRWYYLDSNSLNVDKRSDWDFYFDEQEAAEVVVSLCHNEKIDLNGIRLLPGGVLRLFVVNQIQVPDLVPGLGPGLDAKYGPPPVLSRQARSELECGQELVFHRPRTTTTTAAEEPLPFVTTVDVINLERRPDRWRTTLERAEEAGFQTRLFRRFRAVDGQRLDPSEPDIARIFSLETWRYGQAKSNPHQDHGYRTNVLGCALSHISLWRRIAEENEDPYSIHLILEDDVVFDPLFLTKWNDLSRDLVQDLSWDLVHLGTLDDRDLYQDERVIYDDRLAPYRRFSGVPRTFGAGAFAYLLRSRTARKLVNLVDSRGVQQAIDWWLVDLYDEIIAYKANLVMSPQGDGRDSDNDQAYDMARLLLKENEGEKTVSFAVTHPRQGAAFILADLTAGIDIAGELLVSERHDLFLKRHALARLCVDVVSVQHLSQEIVLEDHCVGLASVGNLTIPSEKKIFHRFGWYEINVEIRIFQSRIESDPVFIELLPDPDHPRVPLQTAPQGAQVRNKSLDLVVNGVPRNLECNTNVYYECVEDFCDRYEIQPRLDCIAQLTASFASVKS